MPLKSYRRMKHESDKGRDRRLDFERADRAAQKAVNYVCQACRRVPEVACDGRTVTSHHIRLRAQGGTNDPSNLLPVCIAHHDWIHDHPALATQRGLIVRREGSGLTKGTNN